VSRTCGTIKRAHWPQASKEETTMQSNNPVFRRAEGFNGKGTTYPASGMSYPSYGSPTAPPTTVTSGPMTIDSVVQKTGIVLVVMVAAAAVTWLMTGNPTIANAAGDRAATQLYTLSLVGALGGFALSMVNSFKRQVSPTLVIAYAVLEGVFIGAMSKTFQLVFGQGVVTGGVLGTIAAFGGTLAAYKFFNISVGDKFRHWVTAAMFGFVAVSLLDLVLGMFHSSIGFNGLGTMGLVSSFIGVGIAVLMLIMDFDYVERGIAAGLPERESWRAAFGLAVTIVWLYIELLRILSILRSN
jgi:uncharacterized YccA/Bax inhibitor family protein